MNNQTKQSEKLFEQEEKDLARIKSIQESVSTDGEHSPLYDEPVFVQSQIE